MAPFSRVLDTTVSLVTIQALADLGYSVDPSQADDYELPLNTNAGKVVHDGHLGDFCRPPFLDCSTYSQPIVLKDNDNRQKKGSPP